ncbi:MAG TPA: FAD-dependent oxidoreductase, partial [Brevibacterium epidermidis]|nr:FAD-dependent oxidoreductase [Brevibacterium epidermidis]
MNTEFESTADRVVIIGGGPGGYEAALVAAQLGADVMLIEQNRCGGSAVLTDVVPSKSLIATAEMMDEIERSGGLGIRIEDATDTEADTRRVTADLEAVNKRILSLADAQANDIYEGLIRAGVKAIQGKATLAGRDQVHVVEAGGTEYTLEASTILLSVGAHPRELPTAQPDGERILTWTQLYDLDELPEHLIVVGSGVTGAEFASAYRALGTEVTLVSSREKVLPGQDEDAADVLEFVFRNKGMNVLSRSRAASVTRTDSGVEVVLADGR